MSRYPWVTSRDVRGNVVVPVEDAEREVERLRGALRELTMWLSCWRHAVTIRAEGAGQAWDELERLHNKGAALAGAPSEARRESDRALAERVREACAVEAEDYVEDADLCGVPCRDEVSAVGVHLRALDLDKLLGER